MAQDTIVISCTMKQYMEIIICVAVQYYDCFGPLLSLASTACRTSASQASLSQATGIDRVTLSKMVNQRGYSTVTDNLDKLCKFFDCKVGDVAEFVPDEELKS